MKRRKLSGEVKRKPKVRRGGAWHKSASLSLHQPGSWTRKSRREITQWLRRQADFLEKRGDELTDTGPFRASYNVEGRKPKAPKRATPKKPAPKKPAPKKPAPKK